MSIDERTRRAWAYLSRVAEGPSCALHALIGEEGPVGAEARIRARTLSPALLGQTQARHHLDQARSDLAVLSACGGRLVTVDDDEWPEWKMSAFGGVTPAPSRVEGKEPVAPVALWVRGPARLDELVERAVAVVGTRDVSGYGERVGAQLCHDLVADGVAVVSGAAYGVDGVAHRAVLAAGGATLAVLACGVDRAYPAGHGGLLNRIATTGIVLSEHPPGTTAARFRFLARNRIVAGLGGGAVVVEAGWRSGARSTISWARALGLPAMAIPGPVTSLQSTGCHRMIVRGEAELVTSAADVVERIGHIGELATEPADPPRLLDALTPTQLQVFEVLPTRTPLPLSLVAERSGVPMQQVRPTMVSLEIEGLVVCTDEGWSRARHARTGA